MKTTTTYAVFIPAIGADWSEHRTMKAAERELRKALAFNGSAMIVTRVKN